LAKALQVEASYERRLNLLRHQVSSERAEHVRQYERERQLRVRVAVLEGLAALFGASCAVLVALLVYVLR
jgi:hypothetical protein